MGDSCLCCRVRGICILVLFAVPMATLTSGDVPSRDGEFKYYHHPLVTSTYQVIADIEDPCFEIQSGDWYLAKTGSYLGSFYYAIDGPGTGMGKARWTVEGLPIGNYLIEFWADNADYPEDARYEVISDDGTTNVSTNMRYVAAGWHSLGSYNINRVCVVNVSDYWTGAGTWPAVDALRLTLNSALETPPTTTIPPHIGICIDDAGAVDPTNSSTPIYRMLRLPFEMTFAVLPYRSYTNETANEIYAMGSEVVLHQPMAAISVPDSGVGGINDGTTLPEVRTIVSTNLDNMPHCIGMNNHMGSLITQQTDKMQVCMEELASRDLFFYDSRTITESVGYDVAKANGLLVEERDLFIDGANKDQAKELIRALATRALHAPHIPHLGIGHVRTGTADALEEMVSELDAMGVEVWPISKCMAQVIETDYSPLGCSVSTTGLWTTDSNDRFSQELRDGDSFVVTDPAGSCSDSITYNPSLPCDGDYAIYTTWVADSTNATQIQATVSHYGGNTLLSLDQSQTLYDWHYLGTYSCFTGSLSTVTFDDFECTEPGKIFRADAVKYIYAGPPSSSNVSCWSTY